MATTTKLAADELIPAALLSLIREADLVFFAQVLMQWRVVYTTAIETMGVGVNNGALLLLVNLKFVESLTFRELRAVLIHEVYHVILEHIDRVADKNPKVWNIACDLSINQFIKNLPDAALLPTRKPFNLPENLSAEQYYKLIRDANKDQQSQAPTLDDHSAWKSLSEADKQVVKGMLQEAVNAAGRGNVPGELGDAINAWLAPPVINWRHVLRHYLHGSIRAFTRESWKRPHKFFGSSVKGRVAGQTAKLVLAIDTSGSVNDATLNDFMNEIYGIQKLYPVDIDIIECDAEVQRCVTLRKGRKYDYKFKGRGGTDFIPVFDYIAEKRMRPDVLIYLTDGEGRFPEHGGRFSTVWTIVDNPNKEVPFGRTIHMPRTDKEERR